MIAGNSPAIEISTNAWTIQTIRCLTTSSVRRPGRSRAVRNDDGKCISLLYSTVRQKARSGGQPLLRPEREDHQQHPEEDRVNADQPDQADRPVAGKREKEEAKEHRKHAG